MRKLIALNFPNNFFLISLSLKKFSLLFFIFFFFFWGGGGGGGGGLF
jgi:hypothetical protein